MKLTSMLAIFITLAQAKKLRHGQTLYHKKHKNADGTAQRWRVNGKPKTWKRDKSRVSVPLKYGLYNYDTLTEDELKLVQLKEPKARKNKVKLKGKARR
jgi:hypothetical protein